MLLMQIKEKTMSRSKKTIYILAAVCAVNLAFIWGHSLFSVAESSSESSRILRFILSLFRVDASPELFSRLHHILRKCAHFTEFACLGALSASITYCITGRDVSRAWTVVSLPMLFCLLAASTDETIQIYTGRTNSVSDILLDFCGSLIAIAVFFIVVLIRRNKESSDSEAPADGE